MSTRWVLLVSLLCVTVPKVSRGQYYADRGAVLGGVSGALAGAGIGKHNGETATGALIGGAVGLVTGAAIGNTMDNRARQQMVTRQYVQQQQIRQTQRAVSPYDVIRMSQSGVSEEVMINQIRQYGVQGELQVQDVIALHRQGVPESVISAMQQSGGQPVAVAEPVYVQPAPPPVVVEHHYVAPAPYYRPYPVYAYPRHHHHYHHRPPRGTSISWGVTYRD